MDIYPENTSVNLIEEYYKNNRQMFYDYMDDHVIWIGPATDQYIEGKQNLIQAFEQEDNTLFFRTAQMSSRRITGGSGDTCEILLRFVVYSYFPSGYVDVRNQRISLFWKKVKIEGNKEWRFSLIHISNSGNMDSRDNIYPIHLDEFVIQKIKSDAESISSYQPNRLIAKGENYSTHYIDYKDICYIRGGGGKFCDIYTKNGHMRVRLIIDQLGEMLPKQFYRPHRSYIINLLEITNVKRYKITLQNDVVIPVPEKKYTKVASDINRMIMELQE